MTKTPGMKDIYKKIPIYRIENFVKSNFKIAQVILFLQQWLMYSWTTVTPSVIFLPLIKVDCEQSIKSFILILSLLAKTLEIILTEQLIKEIGLKSFKFLAPTFCVIN